MHHPKKCRNCGATRRIHLHHLTYTRLGHELDRDLMWLCARCHLWPHRLRHALPFWSLATWTRLYIYRWEVTVGPALGGTAAWLFG
ncbi:hypothetical protein GCM10023203_57440 [Actinomycetospora straminea]|uniref:HNH endonuclease n=1 Tax=Actinomycetospora straminea TaxID=663607 RepID=A0ABP9FAF3_9PSEU